MSINASEPLTVRAAAGGISRIRDAERIARGWAVLEVCGIFVLLLLFNVFPHKIGILVSAGDPDSFVALLTPEFQAHMPLLNLLWSLALALALAKLVYGRWTPSLRWMDLGLGLLSIYVLIRLLAGGPIVGVEAGQAAVAENLILNLSRFIKLGLGVTLLAVGVGLVQRYETLHRHLTRSIVLPGRSE
jgi:hypothetical protein